MKDAETRSAGKVDDLDVVAGIVEQFVRPGLFVREMRRDQSQIAGVEPPQQIVEWPVAAVRRLRCAAHFRMPPFVRSDNNRSYPDLCVHKCTDMGRAI